MTEADKNKKTLEEMVAELPIEFQREVEDFVFFLKQKSWGKKKSKRKPKFDWVGSLKGIDEPKSSVDIQHEISKMRAEEL